MKYLISLIIYAIITQFVAADPCCVTCEVEGQEKYYSAPKLWNTCGEACMSPDDYDKYKKFEPGLTKANSSTPCADLHFSVYVDTLTHGAGPIAITFDMYEPETKFVETSDPCCVTCEVEGQEKYYSIDKRFNNCGECCMSPDDYDLYSKFEKGLEKANSSTPCADLHFNVYIETVTHGAGPIKMTLDMYDPESTKP
jgi:hypothetical protein